jgi:hypothetical protein
MAQQAIARSRQADPSSRHGAARQLFLAHPDFRDLPHARFPFAHKQLRHFSAF